MIKILLISLALIFSSVVQAKGIITAYFAGGCFWCMEEAFEKIDGVIEVISGYSGGKTKNPTYKEVTYGDTGHFEAIEIKYDESKLNYKQLLDIFWKNINPLILRGSFVTKVIVIGRLFFII